MRQPRCRKEVLVLLERHVHGQRFVDSLVPGHREGHVFETVCRGGFDRGEGDGRLPPRHGDGVDPIIDAGPRRRDRDLVRTHAQGNFVDIRRTGAGIGRKDDPLAAILRVCHHSDQRGRVGDRGCVGRGLRIEIRTGRQDGSAFCWPDKEQRQLRRPDHLPPVDSVPVLPACAGMRE